MGATAEQVRDFDQTGASVQKNSSDPNMDQLVLEKDANVTRTTYADQTSTNASAPAITADYLAGDSRNNYDIPMNQASLVVAAEFKTYKYSMKEVVLATDAYPPGPESTWRMGKVFEFMLGEQIKVKLRDGKKIVVQAARGQIRPMQKNEIDEYKQTHKGEAEVPMWAMIVFCPCMLIAAPFYFLGCCGGEAGLTDCLDCCEPCFEACEACGDICECCC